MQVGNFEFELVGYGGDPNRFCRSEYESVCLLQLMMNMANKTKVETQVKGYPSLATFLDSYEGYMIYRRYGWLQSRLLLDKQEELRTLEENLQRLDLRKAQVRSTTPMTRTGPVNEREPRRVLLEKIEKAFLSYCKGHFCC